MDSRAMVSMNYKAMRFNGLLNNAFNGFQSWDSKDFKTMASRDGFKNYFSINSITMGSLGSRTMGSMDGFQGNGQSSELWVTWII